MNILLCFKNNLETLKIYRDHKTRVTIESNNKEDTRKAKERFCSLIPPDIVVIKKL